MFIVDSSRPMITNWFECDITAEWLAPHELLWNWVWENVKADKRQRPTSEAEDIDRGLNIDDDPKSSQTDGQQTPWKEGEEDFSQPSVQSKEQLHFAVSSI